MMDEAEWLSSDEPAKMLEYLCGTPPNTSGSYIDPSVGFWRDEPRLSPRKLRLFGVACCREADTFLADFARADLATLESWADYWPADTVHLGAMISRLRHGADYRGSPSRCYAVLAVHHAAAGEHFRMLDYLAQTAGDSQEEARRTQAALLREIAGNPFRPVAPLWESVKVGDEVLLEKEPNYHLRKRRQGERPANAEIVATLPGNKVMVRPAYGGNPGTWDAPKPTPLSPWLTPTVLSLAQAAYDERPPRWVSTPLRGVSTGYYVDNGHLDPVRLAILADALEEAGCTDLAILLHLRGWHQVVLEPEAPGVRIVWHRPTPPEHRYPHVRGCHVLDLILGKE